MTAWEHAVRSLELPTGQVALDVGAGAGQFVDPLLRWTGRKVVALEPASGMRQQAVESQTSRQASWIAGVAESLPLASGAVDLVWLLTVVHQFPNREAALAEIGRVVAPGGRVLVRTFSRDLPPSTFLSRFPGSTRVANSFPSAAELVSDFGRAQFEPCQGIVVDEERSAPVQIWLENAFAMRRIDLFFAC